MTSSIAQKKKWVDPEHEHLSIRSQCELLALNRSTLYSQKGNTISTDDLRLMRMIDEIYTRCPFYGSRRITAQLNRESSLQWNRKCIQRLMRIMRIRGVAPGPDTSKSHPENKIYPYLLRGAVIDKPNQAWSTDITYIPMMKGFMYLVAVIDWYARYVLSWSLSNTLETAFCTEALENALTVDMPEIGFVQPIAQQL